MAVCPDCDKEIRNGSRALRNHRRFCKAASGPPVIVAEKPVKRRRLDVAEPPSVASTSTVDEDFTMESQSDNDEAEPRIPDQGPFNNSNDTESDGILLANVVQDNCSMFDDEDNDWVDEVAPAAPESPKKPVRASSRRIRVPGRLRDLLPGAQMTALRQYTQNRSPSASPKPALPSQQPSPSPRESPTNSEHETEPNTFGLYRVYADLPQADPEDQIILDDLVDAPTFSTETSPGQRGFSDVFGFNGGEPNSQASLFAPFRNMSVFRLMQWFYETTTKTLNDLNRLVQNVIRAPDFKSSDFIDFDASREAKRLDKPQGDGWKESVVEIKLPQTGVEQDEDDAPVLEVPGVLHRDLLEILKASYQHPSAKAFTWKGFKQMWKPDDDAPVQRVYSEAYTSDVFLKMEKEIQESRPPDCTLEAVVAPIMCYSDSSRLASFGTASLWPGYLWWGSLSKYIRAKPTSFSANHFVYIPSLPDTVQDIYNKTFGSPASAAVLTFLKRQLFHAIWALLLTPEFMDAYVNGIVILCGDGIWRRVFPRFFTYSADYPEKILIAGVNYLGEYLCVTCHTTKENVDQLGTARDGRSRLNLRQDSQRRQTLVEKARSWIFDRGLSVTAKAIKKLLSHGSIVPIRNAFSEKLLPQGFNFFQMLVVDLMHEFELGVWKDLLTWIIRILYAHGTETIQQLNERFRLVPAFGRAIRRFRNDVCSLKGFAARDYEDVLQCIIPCIEGLLPPVVEVIVLDTLFIMATWHGLAKMRMHTDFSLDVMEVVTRLVGSSLRQFRDEVCSLFETEETPAQSQKRARRQAREDARRKAQGLPPIKRRLPKKKPIYSLFTSKLHQLGHYVLSIVLFGTTDSYSTQTGELEHRRIKRFYVRTNKNVFQRQIARIERRTSYFRKTKSSQSDSEDLPPADPSQSYQMPKSRSAPVDLIKFRAENKDDKATQDLIPHLKAHLLQRITGQTDDFTAAELSTVEIQNNRIFSHQVLRINYTTYDVRRDQDSINARTRSDIMVLSGEGGESYPYWYARVFGIYHAMVRRRGETEFVQMDFLWVRWFGLDEDYDFGFAAKRLPRIGYLDANNDPTAFGFIDPASTLRAVHLIPGFAHGQTSELLPPSIARRPDENDEDYNRYYVNMFVDRDMLVRFCGMGVGHKSTRHATRVLERQLREAMGLQTDEVTPDEQESNASEVSESGSEEELEAESEGAADNGQNSDYDSAEEDDSADVDDESEESLSESDDDDGDGENEEILRFAAF
ncbi:hypothetical protein C8J56DRAFT_1083768 [Mycena floridula]|nr:hypothetical protein C8J56DRAFT_1083768 [Mycena floridula]